MMSKPASTDSKRVLVVDGEERIVDFLATGLSSEGWSVSSASDGQTALETAYRERPDLVILDVKLPGLDGFTVYRRLRDQSDVPIIVLTARGELEERVAGLAGGTDAYLTKPFRFQELLSRIRAMQDRRASSIDSVVTVADVRLNRETRRVERAGRPVYLTQMEFDLLELLLDQAHQALSRETILNRLWGYDFVGDTNVLDVHIAALRRKLGDTEHALIQTVRGAGYGFLL
jgi:DNA-binding response OmpR family regulator